MNLTFYNNDTNNESFGCHPNNTKLCDEDQDAPDTVINNGPAHFAIPMFFLSLIFGHFLRCYHNSLSCNERNLIVFLDIIITNYQQAANIIFLVPIIWRTYFGLIPIIIARMSDILGRFCNFNSMANFMCLSILRLLLYYKVSFSMETDQKLLSKGIFGFCICLWLGVNLPPIINGKWKQFGHFLYLTNSEPIITRYNVVGLMLLTINVAFMISVELFLTIKLRTWPSLLLGGKLKSVFVAILGMIVVGVIHFATINYPEFNSIRLSLLPFTFQVFYMLKIHDYVRDQCKEMWNFTIGKRTENKEDESNMDLNEFGIYVGPSQPPININEAESSIKNMPLFPEGPVESGITSSSPQKGRKKYLLPFSQISCYYKLINM